MKLKRIQSIFEDCLRETGVFNRDKKNIIESEVVKLKDGDWLVIAAGIKEAEGKPFFKTQEKRLEKALTPLALILSLAVWLKAMR